MDRNDRYYLFTFIKGKNILTIDSNNCFKWKTNEIYHRIHGPAHIYKHYNVITSTWYLNRKKHNDNGSAEYIYKNGNLRAEYWYTLGKQYNNNKL